MSAKKSGLNRKVPQFSVPLPPSSLQQRSQNTYRLTPDLLLMDRESAKSDNYFNTMEIYSMPETAKLTVQNPPTMQDFMRQTTEIGEEIKQISELFKQISPQRSKKAKTLKDDEEIVWEDIDKILVQNSIQPLSMVADSDPPVPEYSSLASTVVSLARLVSQSPYIQDSLKYNNSIVSELRADVTKLKKENKSLRHELRKIKSEKVSLLEENMKLKSNTEMVSRNEGEIFKTFIHRSFDPNHYTDRKIMSLISMYEKNKLEFEKELIDLKSQILAYRSQEAYSNRSSAQYDWNATRSSTNSPDFLNNSLKSIFEVLTVSNTQEALHSIEKMQDVIKVIPNIEKFVSLVYNELLPSSSSSSNTHDIGFYMERIIPSIRSMKNSLDSAKKLRQILCENLDLSPDTTDEVIVDKTLAIKHFRKLFGETENDLENIEEVYIFVYEMKNFLSHTKELLGTKNDISINLLINEIIAKLTDN
ncbi:unnamed protein product [Blepharisma stoltei]|uniref:Uncharacterized protein n=1 Tax=Blepharisma stoltei TaxID=1481888 RepID=A0AAU9II11_9CILI|nr:unnamed protein product [Blepharisma stoltei]